MKGMNRVKSKIIKFKNELRKAILLPIAILSISQSILFISYIVSRYLNTDNFYMSFLTYFVFILESLVKIICENSALILGFSIVMNFCKADILMGIIFVVGFIINNMIISIVANIGLDNLASPMCKMVLSVPSLDTGIVLVLLWSIVVIYISKYVEHLKKKDRNYYVLSLVITFISFAIAGFIGVIFGLAWPIIQETIFNFSKFLINSKNIFVPFIYGFIDRLLSPFELEYLWENSFLNMSGEYINNLGQIVTGDFAVFFKQLTEKQSFIFGHYMAGEYICKMFSLPFIILAIYKKRKDENDFDKILIVIAILCFLLGVSRPLELFLLVFSPLIFIVYCLISAIAFFILALFNINIGILFSGGLIEFIIFSLIQQNLNVLKLLVLGVIFAAIYYFSSLLIIKKNKIKFFKGEKNNSKKDEEIVKEELVKKKKDKIVEDVYINFFSPAKGKLVEFDEINNRIFSSRIMGDGFAFYVDDEKIRSIYRFKVKKILEENKAVILETKKGINIIMKIGIDIKFLSAKAFEIKVEEGDLIQEHQVIWSLNKEKIDGDLKLAVAFTNLKKNQKLQFNAGHIESMERNRIRLKIK